MGRRVQTCKHRDCSEERSRYSSYGFCPEHEDEAQAQEQDSYDADPKRDIERQLENATTVEDLKDFIREHLMDLL
jgi:hypothetical protein